VRRLLVTALVLVGATTAAAYADGPGAGGIGTSLVVPGGRISYTAAISRDSTRTRIAMWGRRTLVHELRLDGPYGFPFPVSNGNALSHDESSVVLARLDRSTFALLDAKTLRLRRAINLGGSFTFDALSPHGRTMYLIQHVASHYYVRAYDVTAGRLLKQIVFDAREKGEPMAGLPVTRAVGPSGRWVYTLYARPAGTLFVHALDTVDRHAFCIDLPRHFSQAQAWRMNLGVKNKKLLVGATWATRPLAVIDVRTLRVSA
jgi:hypothetical protein